jgi:endogenous inhibitor of DNA gyrase (YacG/DUF329 family)
MAVKEIRACKYCGAKFEAKTKWHDFCKDRCRMNNWIIESALKVSDERRKHESTLARSND